MSDTSPLERPTSMREKLAQLIFVRIGSNLPPVQTADEDAGRIQCLLKECPLGGLILFNGRQGSTAQTLASLQTESQFPLLVTSDIERGVGQQLLGHTMFPHAMAFDALGDDAESAVKHFAKLTAAMARANGIHITFGPVADVNIDPLNPIIATRAFGDKPERVSQLVQAFIEGCQSEGLLATAKHYPGHGNTHEDSHSELPKVDSSREELEACEFTPFQAAIEADVALIMSAHVQYPALDPTGKPATLSYPILTELLRNQLGFQGAEISDSLLMEGVKQESADEGTLAVEALEAGVDILLDVAEPVATLNALEAAVTQGRLSEERVEEAFNRLWGLKEKIFGGPPRPAGIFLGNNFMPDELGEKVATSFAQECAKRAVHLVQDKPEILPLDPKRKLSAVLIKPFETNLDLPEQPLAAELRKRFAEVSYSELGPSSEQAELEEAFEHATGAEQVLVAMIVKPAAWHRFGLEERYADLLQKILQHKNCVLASLGTPEALKSFDAVGTQICTYSDVDVSQIALADRLVDSGQQQDPLKVIDQPNA